MNPSFDILHRFLEIQVFFCEACSPRLTSFVLRYQEVLHVAQAEMQLAACAAFLQVLQRQLVPVQNYTQTFLQSILVGIDSKEPGTIITLSSSSFPLTCPIIWGRRSGNQWFFTIVLSFFPAPQLSCLCPQHPFTLSSVFLFLFFLVVSCLSSCRIIEKIA